MNGKLYMLKWHIQQANFHADKLAKPINEHMAKGDLHSLKFFIRKAKKMMSELEKEKIK